MNAEVMKKVELASSTAEDFTRLYYKKMDKSRHLIDKMYLESAVLVWNGNGAGGDTDISRFLLELPASEHTLNTLDAQPVVDEALAASPTFLVQVAGLVRYHEANDRQDRPFQQTFIITAQGDKWKIVSDCFRTQAPVARD